MTDPDFRALCAELVEKWDNAAELDDLCDVADVMDRARAALAQPEVACVACEGKPASENSPCAVCGAQAQSEAEGPTNEDLQLIMPQSTRMDFSAVAQLCASKMYPDSPQFWDKVRMWEAQIHKASCEHARAVLTRWGRPAIAPDGPAVPHGREPASVTHQPTDKELHRLMHSFVLGGESPEDFSFDHCGFARAALARWGRPAIEPELGETVLPPDGFVEADHG